MRTLGAMIVDANGNLINFLFSERILKLQLQRPATVLNFFGHAIRNKFNLERARGRLL